MVAAELSPVDVSLVVILEQNLPFFKRSAMAVALPSPTGDDLGSRSAFAVGVCTRIEWVLEKIEVNKPVDDKLSKPVK